MKLNAVLAGFVAACLTACVVAPTQHAITNSETYNADFDTTWSRLVQFFAAHNMQIKTIDKASGVLSAEQAFATGSDYGRYADCGQPGPTLRIVGTGGSLNVFVVEENKSIRVTVNTVFRQRRQFENNLTTVDCTSTGALEQQILVALR